MKVIDAEKGYHVLDDLFAQIEANNYVATAEMLNDACARYSDLPACCDIEEISRNVENLAGLCMNSLAG